MQTRSILLCLGLAWFAAAAPLNINLGAYSPALVVGDGEISFGGAEGAAGAAAIESTLQGTSTAAGANTAAAAAAPAAAAAAPATAQGQTQVAAASTGADQQIAQVR